ncbi:hypothetical protein SVIO_025520 [Streptomyces violaceusniger]|uniref:AMP-dependent synthetase/ligase domain-containing protein n=1 Tax=Streptomyces violaceusniger TaxID=68280 RepID=A0A4D4L1L3_STRVO|nr:hypothetical protein SVIO_025520 [Streptomyces violaceusniger]
MRVSALGALEHQEVPFERLVEELAPVRSVACHPLFQVMLAVQNVPAPTADFPDVSVEGLLTEVTLAKFDLDFQVSERFDDAGRPAGQDVEILYAADLFDRATVERIAARMLRVLHTVAAEPGTPVHAIDVLDESERRLLADVNDTALARPGATVPELFAAQAAARPDAVAVSADTARLTYAQLDADSNRLARHLIDHGVGPDILVAVVMERSPELVAVLLAVLKAGGAYVPVDPDQPHGRLQHIFGTAQPALLVTTSSLQHHLEGVEGGAGGVAQLVIDDPATAEHVAQHSSTPLTDTDRTTPLRPDHLAYVMFTSGSTGVPKGVAVAHRGVVNLLSWIQSRVVLSSADRVLCKASFGFDTTMFELFWPLLEGAAVVVARPGGQHDPGYLAQLIVREQVTVIKFVPSALAVFLQAGAAAECTSLRAVLVGGEALSPGLCEEFKAGFTAPLHNLYGPTEASACCCGAFEVAPGRNPARQCPSGVRRTTPSCMSSTVGCSRCRWGWPVSCMWPAPGRHAVTCTSPA